PPPEEPAAAANNKNQPFSAAFYMDFNATGIQLITPISNESSGPSGSGTFAQPAKSTAASSRRIAGTRRPKNPLLKSTPPKSSLPCQGLLLLCHYGIWGSTFSSCPVSCCP